MNDLGVHGGYTASDVAALQKNGGVLYIDTRDPHPQFSACNITGTSGIAQFDAQVTFVPGNVPLLTLFDVIAGYTDSGISPFEIVGYYQPTTATIPLTITPTKITFSGLIPGDSKQDKTPAMDHYEILEKRAAYDVHLGSSRKFRLWILDQREAAAVKEAERSKRRGILELLYSARRNQPGQPTVSIHELEELLGCPREHLDFSLWYLKENALISSSENERYSITAKGVDHLETEEVARTPKERLLGAGD